MRLCKSDFKILIFFFLINPLFAFDDNSCFNGNYDVEVIHKGQPFGLLPVKLKIKKEGCALTIQHEKFKYIKKAWQVDICRAPIHIKKGLGAVEVVKKTAPCEGKERGIFCTEFLTMKRLIQDDGLIFAAGEKENLQTDHGKTYCAYLLLNKYLDRSVVFNRGQDYKGKLIQSDTPYPTASASPESEETPPVIQEAPPVPEMVEESEAKVEKNEEPQIQELETKKRAGEGYF